MRRPFNTLFLRLAAMTVGLIVLLHLTFLLLVDRYRNQLEVQHVAYAVMTAVTVREHDAALAPLVAARLGVQYRMDDALARDAACPGQCRARMHPIEKALLERLPPGSRVRARTDGSITVQLAGSPYAIVVQKGMLPPTRFVGASFVMLVFAVVGALVFAWQLQKPVRALARAAREFRVRGGFRDLPLSGPNEIREVTANFNAMAGALSEAERERAVMLAGLAHDLRAPITRVQVRADLLNDAHDRAAFLRDVDSMSRIVDQFLDFARDDFAPSPPAGVDALCRRDYGELNAEATRAHGAAQQLVALDLQAGEDFRLPELEVERILTNLVQNAMVHGAPPVEISTRRVREHYVLCVRDHGQGVPREALASIPMPFVRLDPARGGAASCGLGLAIVRRLVRNQGGALTLDNAPDGGLVVTMTFKP